MMTLWRADGNWRRLVLSFLHVGPWDWTRVCQAWRQALFPSGPHQSLIWPGLVSHAFSPSTQRQRQVGL